MVHAHLMLLQRATEQASLLARSTLRPDETVGLLTNAGMFDLAFELCRLFDLSMVSVFEGVTLRYIRKLVLIVNLPQLIQVTQSWSGICCSYRQMLGLCLVLQGESTSALFYLDASG